MTALTPRQVGQRLRRIRERLAEEVLAAERMSVLDALATAEKFSSGQVSEAQLAAMGHPFAKRHPQPLLNPAIINVQSGAFLRDWQSEGPLPVAGGGLKSRIFNTNPVAEFLEKGTRYMIARPLIEAVREEVMPRRDERLRYAIRRALKG